MRADRHLTLLLFALLPGIAGASGWPQPALPDGTTTAEVARRIVFNGLDMRSQTFQSRQSQAEVVAYYRKLWNGKVVVNPMGNDQVVGHLEGDYYITVQVSSYGGGSKGNIGIVDVTSAPKHFERGHGLPRPMGSRVFNDIAYPDDPTPARTVAMRNALSPAQNASFFRERLLADGWKSAEAGPCADSGCVQRYERGDSKLTLVLNRMDGQSQVVINELNP